jgi:hypothetical protein
MSEHRKAGVIVNPAAGRGNGKGLALARMLQGQGHVNLQVMQNFDSLRSMLSALAAAEVTDLFISSGDGTIQAIQTLLAETRLFGNRPRLCILPHGTTNLTGIDIGFSQRNIASQAAFISSLPHRPVLKRHSLRIVNPRDGFIRHGMTLGAGAAARATRLTQTDFNDRGKKGQLAAARMLAGAVGKALFTRPRPGDLARLDRPCTMHIWHEGQIIADGPQLMFFATTLEKQFFNTRPFWGGRNGEIRASLFPYPMPNLVRWLPTLMYGSEDRKVPPGCISFSGHAFEISCPEPFVMDGEFFEAPLEGALRVETGPAFEFIV